MDLTEFARILKTTGLPVAYRSFPEGDSQNPPPNLPFICYLETGTTNFAADGVVYQKIKELAVELYTKNKDVSVEEKVEKALSSFYWNKEEDYLDDEKCYMIVYSLEV